MGSLTCLSSAANLRCETLSRIQTELLIIPTALEVIFSISLIAAKWGSGNRIHLLLALEGMAFFFLALLDMLSHIIPAARNSMNVFQVLDILIASASFIPILLYTLFLFLFVSGEIIQNLPQRFQLVVKYILAVFVPAIAVLSEIGSFVGISRRMISGTILAIGFKDEGDRTLWTFFSSLTLALLTFYQAINFVLTFYQLIKVFIDKRRIEVSQSDEGHMVQGTGWMTTGIKLGAIETVIGFAPMGFGGAFTRRIIRLLARACLAIGVVKGMDKREDFRHLDDELRGQTREKGWRRSGLKLLISNPRNSTFRRLSTSQAAFNDNARAPTVAANRSNATIASFNNLNKSATGYQTANYSWSNDYPGAQAVNSRAQRVTVHYANGQAPTLEMRFSALDMPSPAVLAEAVKSRPQSEWLTANTRATARLSLTNAFKREVSDSSQHSISRPTPTRSQTTQGLTSADRQRYKRNNSFVRHESVMSAESLASDSLEVVRDLAGRFPGLPSRVTGKSPSGESVINGYNSDDGYPVMGVSRHPSYNKGHKTGQSLASTVNTISPSNSLTKRKPVPSIPRLETVRASAQTVAVYVDEDHEVSYDFKGSDTVASSPYSQVSSPFGTTSRRVSTIGTPDTDAQNPFSYDNSALPSGKSEAFEDGNNGSGESVNSAQWLATASRAKRAQAVDIAAYRAGIKTSKTASPTYSEALSERGEFGNRITSDNSVEIPWLTNDDAESIKGVGKAPRKTTPEPTHVGFSRKSITLEHRKGASSGTHMSSVGEELRRDPEVSGQAV